MDKERDRAIGALVGLAAGDAVGTTLEFKPRDSYEPLVDMVGGGPFNLSVGEWTDDTSMALCLGESLNKLGEFDAEDQMHRYTNWYEHGYMSSNGTCFDIGNTVLAAIAEFKKNNNPLAGSTHANSAGNGSLMRLAPVVLFCFNDLELIKKYSRMSSLTTHGAAECVESCSVFGELTYRALSGCEKSDVLKPVSNDGLSARLNDIASMNTLDKPRDQISGSGYVVDCLEASLWCFARTNCFKDAVLMAANLGNDADTTAAVCGQIAGAYYGLSGIPAEWVDKLKDIEMITTMASELYEAAP